MTNLIHIKMNIKEITDKSLDFTVKRVSEVFGITLTIAAALLLASLSSYSPEDPNFIFQNNSKIKNLLGFQGSYVSDLFLQTIGLISFLVPISIFFTGINIFRSKKILLFLDNLFFIIVYCIFGSLFFSSFYSKSFWLVINGNGGFVGNFINNEFLGNLINLNENIAYYLLLSILIPCSCLELPLPEEAYNESDLVFSGEVTSIVLNESNYYKDLLIEMKLFSSLIKNLSN